MLGDKYLVNKRIVGMEGTAEIGTVLQCVKADNYSVFVLADEFGRVIIEEGSNGCVFSCSKLD